MLQLPTYALKYVWMAVTERTSAFAEREARMQVWQCILSANTSWVLKVALTLDCSCPAFVILYNPAPQRCVLCTQDARPCVLCLAAPACVLLFPVCRLLFLRCDLFHIFQQIILCSLVLLSVACFSFCYVTFMDQVSSDWLSGLQKHCFILNRFLIFHTDARP